MRWVFNATSRLLYSWGWPSTNFIGGWVGPGTVWTGGENFANNRIRSSYVQSVTSRYNDCAIPAQRNRIYIISKSSDGHSWMWKKQFSSKRWCLCSWIHDTIYTRSLSSWRRKHKVSPKRCTYHPEFQIGPIQPPLSLRTQCSAQELKRPENKTNSTIPTHLWRWNSVPKRWHLNYRGRWITQRKHTT
jgi:hypothetical protein